MKRILTLVGLLSFFSTAALAAERYSCTIPRPAQTPVEPFDKMDLNWDGKNLTGTALVYQKMVPLTLNEYHQQIEVEVTPETKTQPTHVSLTLYDGHDIFAVSFFLVEGTGVAESYQFLDCLGETRGTETVVCQKVP